MGSCLQVVTTRINELKLTVTQLCPRFIIKSVYLISEDGDIQADAGMESNG